MNIVKFLSKIVSLTIFMVLFAGCVGDIVAMPFKVVGEVIEVIVP